MEEENINIEEIFIHELKEKGIEHQIMHRFIKDLAYSFEDNPSITVLDVNRWLHFLGWKDVDMDYHTLQLAIASFERRRENIAS